MTIEIEGYLQVDDQSIKWDRNSASGLAIEFDFGERLHIGGDPSEERFRLAIHAFRNGLNTGIGRGKAHLRSKIKSLLEIRE